MPIKFEPNYTITPDVAHDLMRIESAKELETCLDLNRAQVRAYAQCGSALDF